MKIIYAGRMLIVIALSIWAAGCDSEDTDDGGGADVTVAGCLGASAEGGRGVTLRAVQSVSPWLRDFPGLGELIDQQMVGTSAYAAQQFGVQPRIQWLDDSGQPNAYATTEGGAQDGSVWLGVNLVSSEIRRFVTTEQSPERQYTYSVTAVVAHELGHTVQFRNNAGGPGKHTELQADYLAGWYFSVLARKDANYQLSRALDDGLRVFFERGDYEFNSPLHHGTPQARAAAFTAGFQANAQGIGAAWAGAVRYRQQIGG